MNRRVPASSAPRELSGEDGLAAIVNRANVVMNFESNGSDLDRALAGPYPLADYCNATIAVVFSSVYTGTDWWYYTHPLTQVVIQL